MTSTAETLAEDNPKNHANVVIKERVGPWLGSHLHGNRKLALGVKRPVINKVKGFRKRKRSGLKRKRGLLVSCVD